MLEAAQGLASDHQHRPMHSTRVHQSPDRRLTVDTEGCGKDGFKNSFGVRAMDVEQIVLGLAFLK